MTVDCLGGDALPNAVTEGLLEPVPGKGEEVAVACSPLTEGEEDWEKALDAVVHWVGEVVTASTEMDGEVEEEPLSVAAMPWEGEDWALCEPLLLGLYKD